MSWGPETTAQRPKHTIRQVSPGRWAATCGYCLWEFGTAFNQGEARVLLEHHVRNRFRVFTHWNCRRSSYR